MHINAKQKQQPGVIWSKLYQESEINLFPVALVLLTGAAGARIQSDSIERKQTNNNM